LDFGTNFSDVNVRPDFFSHFFSFGIVMYSECWFAIFVLAVILLIAMVGVILLKQVHESFVGSEKFYFFKSQDLVSQVARSPFINSANIFLDFPSDPRVVKYF